MLSYASQTFNIVVVLYPLRPFRFLCLFFKY